MDTPTASEALDILGLNPSEQRVVQATSKMALSVTDIAISTKLPRTSLLYILTKLKKRQLVKRICVGKRFFWKSDLQKPLKQLSHVPISSFKSGPSYLNTDNGIVIYRGINAIMSIFEKMISQPHNTRIYGIQPDNSIKYALRKVSTKEWNRVNTTMKKQSLIFEGIVHEKSVETVIKETGKKGALDIFNSFIGRLEDYVKIPDEFANVEAEIYIFKNSAYIVNWNKEMAIEIIDKDMVSLLLAMFSSVKTLGQRYSQTKRMEIYKESIKKKLLP